jgi:hypothetical protein
MVMRPGMLFWCSPWRKLRRRRRESGRGPKWDFSALLEIERIIFAEVCRYTLISFVDDIKCKDLVHIVETCEAKCIQPIHVVSYWPELSLVNQTNWQRIMFSLNTSPSRIARDQLDHIVRSWMLRSLSNWDVLTVESSLYIYTLLLEAVQYVMWMIMNLLYGRW